MWQDVAAIGIVAGAVALMAFRAIRRRRRGMVGGCSACRGSADAPPQIAYLIPSDSLTVVRPDGRRPSEPR